MNLILLAEDEIHNDQAVVSGRGLEHILTHIRPSIGDTLKAGILNGPMGLGLITEISDERLVLELSLKDAPPAPLPVKLVLAMPRPKVLGRVLQHAAAMGVKDIHIIRTWRVEKSYWESPVLEDDHIRHCLLAGLEQGRDTLMPSVRIHRLFTPFVRDTLPRLAGDSMPLIFHPAENDSCPRGVEGSVTLAVGPEGGFIEREVDSLLDMGFVPVSLGRRILRVETVIPFIIGRLF
jgi:RsmE family RNA methyltransferase